MFAIYKIFYITYFSICVPIWIWMIATALYDKYEERQDNKYYKRRKDNV